MSGTPSNSGTGDSRERAIVTGSKETQFLAAHANRGEIIHPAPERVIGFQQVALLANTTVAERLALLCHLAFNAPCLTSRKRGDLVKRKQAAIFNYLRPEARIILNDVLEKYLAEGELQYTLPDVPKVRPISNHGNFTKINGEFGGADKLSNGVNQLQSLL